MLTEQSNRSSKYRKGRFLSESSLINGFVNSPIFRLLLFKWKEAAILLLKQFLESNSAILSSCYTFPTRIHHGQLRVGLVLGLMGCSVMLAYNSEHIWVGLAPLAGWGVPILPFFYDYDTLYQWVVIDIRSKALLIYCGVYLLSALIHTVLAWVGLGNKNATLRGESYVFWLIRRLLSKTNINAGYFFIHFIEALGAVALGTYLWIYEIDPYFGGFLILIAGNEVVSLLTEKSRAIHHQALMDA